MPDTGGFRGVVPAVVMACLAVVVMVGNSARIQAGDFEMFDAPFKGRVAGEKLFFKGCVVGEKLLDDEG